MAATKPNRFANTVALRGGPTPTPGSTGEATRKYTVLMAATTADQLDADLLELRRHVGKKVDKSEVLRVLIALLHDDETLRATVAERLSAS